jgi:hypothetical protein
VTQSLKFGYRNPQFSDERLKKPINGILTKADKSDGEMMRIG